MAVRLHSIPRNNCYVMVGWVHALIDTATSYVEEYYSTNVYVQNSRIKNIYFSMRIFSLSLQLFSLISIMCTFLGYIFLNHVIHLQSIMLRNFILKLVLKMSHLDVIVLLYHSADQFHE